MATTYSNFQSGTITDNPLSNVATTVNSSAFASLPAVTAPDTMWLVLDPNGVNGAPEIVQITAHTAAATSVTVVRAQQSTSARSHPVNSAWTVAVTKSDLDELPFRKLTSTGDTLYASAANTASRLAIGATGTVLKSNGSTPSWGAVTSADIQDGTIATGDLADGAVTSAKIADGTIVNGDVNASAGIALSKLAAGSSAQLIVADGTGVPTYRTVTGDVTVSNTGVTAIGSGKVTSDMILNGTIVDGDINASAAIGYGKLALTGQIVNADVAAGAALAVSKLAAGTSAQVLMNNGTPTPTWTSLTGDVTVGATGVTAIGAGKVTDAMLNSTAGNLGGAWTTWTPSYANLTVGNGTVIARYMLVGKTLFFMFQLTLGTTSSVSSGPRVSLPSNSQTDNTLDFPITYDIGGQLYWGSTKKFAANSVTLQTGVPFGGQTLLNDASSTSPGTFGTGSIIRFRGQYEVA